MLMSDDKERVDCSAFGVVAVAFEAPFLCVFIEPVARFASFSEGRPYWQKAALYGLSVVTTETEISNIESLVAVCYVERFGGWL